MNEIIISIDIIGVLILIAVVVLAIAIDSVGNAIRDLTKYFKKSDEDWYKYCDNDDNDGEDWKKLQK